MEAYRMSKTEATTDDEQTTTELTFTVRGSDLPTDRDDPLVEDLTAEIAALVENQTTVATEDVDVNAHAGPFYVRVRDSCPMCGSAVEMTDTAAHTDGFASASSSCTDDECRWHGNAQFALIDFAGYDGEGDVVEAVNNGQKRPLKRSY
ncbi:MULTISPECIES: hypothetical protein [unclassified Haloferax]|uniref:hypothetical protein n=1 Tax=unclassified Haloferax TaxID=2625095 RepID=UPI002875F3D7|nr:MULTISPECIES: hypothetical protein [unclassified Haloferax]MDS0243133.1 hypothetical protein [Haloferax sp. S2CR25]MDS0446254.1 hypothetical protein [Haloferax sp. S2CR25-2]